MKKQTYQITGIVDYASIIDFEVEACSIKEARQMAERIDHSDPASAEMQSVLIDEPELIK